MRVAKTTMALLLVGLIILLTGCGLSSYTQTLMLDPIDYQDDITLIVNNDLGDITVYNNDQEEIRIRATITGRAESEVQARDVTEAIEVITNYNQNSNKLILEYEKDNLHFDHRLSIDYDIIIPEDYNAELKTGSGEIGIEKMKGDLQAETRTGKLDINELEGNIISDSWSGNTIINTIKADNLNIETRTGKVNIKKLDGSGLRTTNEILTVTGDIILKFVDNIGIEARTFTGNIIFEGTDQGDRFDWGTDPDLKLESRNGNIYFGRH